MIKVLRLVYKGDVRTTESIQETRQTWKRFSFNGSFLDETKKYETKGFRH